MRDVDDENKSSIPRYINNAVESCAGAPTGHVSVSRENINSMTCVK